MYQRTIRVSVTSGLMPDVMLRLDSEVASIARAAPGFIGYFAVATDDTTLVTTRISQDQEESLEVETQAASEISNAIAADFGFSELEALVDGPIGVTRGYGPHRGVHAVAVLPRRGRLKAVCGGMDL
jgi:hypothetical protein